jgi:hypothetical protein
MKQTRLLEIIREEIASALGAETTNTFTGRTLEEEKKQFKYKQLAEKYQLDEETINEMASIKQVTKALIGLGDEEKAEVINQVALDTLNQFKKNPIIDPKSERLSRKLEPNEYPNKIKTRTIAYSTEFLKNYKEKTGEDFNELTFEIESQWKITKPGETLPFKSPELAANTTDKDAGNQILGKTKKLVEPITLEPKAKKAPKSLKEPKAEKSSKTEKEPKEKEPKSKESKIDAGTDDEGNKVEIDTTVKALTGDKEIEIKLKDVISKKKDKLKAALKSKDQETYNKEKAALKQFLEKPEITKYIKKKTVDKVNPYTLSSIEDEIK